MKNIIIYKHTHVFWVKIFVFFGLIIVGSSCQKKLASDDLSDGISGLLYVKVAESVFNDEISISNKAVNSSSPSELITNTTELSEDLLLISELRPIGNIAVQNEIITRGANQAATPIKNVLLAGVKYKLVIYRDNGDYVSEHDYVYGDPVVTPVQLNGGSTYTFVAYSINSTSTLPLVTFVNNSAKKLSESTVSANAGEDLMFFKETRTVSGNSPNYLNIVFKHKFNSIKVTVDASITEYEINELEINVPNSHATSALNFSNEVFTHSTPSISSPFVFSGLGTSSTATSTGIFNVTTGVNLDVLSLAKIRVGNITVNNITPFSKVTLIPGVKYEMSLKLANNDAYITHKGYSAVRINGQVWMRHNLGANYSSDPNGTGTAIFGDFYQWGKNSPFMTGAQNFPNADLTATPPVPNPVGWVRLADASPFNSWNAGTEAAPIRGALDPCPPNYRIPTQTEGNAFIQNVVASSTAPSAGVSGIAVYTSRRKKSINLKLPMQGVTRGVPSTGGTGNTETNEWNYRTNDYIDLMASVWTSTRTSIAAIYSLRWFNNNTFVLVSFPLPNKSNAIVGGNIRCIAIDPTDTTP